jgi:hypothetical protein
MAGLRKRFWRTPTAIATGFAIALLASSPAYAVHEFDFELDGNVVTNGASPLVDWNALFNVPAGGGVPTVKSSLPTGFTNATFLRDFDPNSNADSTLFTTGSKDTLPITPGWQCKGTNNVNDKVDLNNTYAVFFTDPGTGHKFVYFGLETASNEGTRDVGVWLLQDKTVTCVSPSGATTAFSGDHKDGDILIVAEYGGSSGVSQINVFKWSGNATTGSLVSVGSGADCRLPDGTDAADGDKTCATTNRAVIKAGLTGIPWLTKTKTSKPSQPGLTSADLDIGEFFEGGIDLTASGITGCFSNIAVDTRSSASTTATLFDFTLGKFQDCNTNVATAIHSGATPADPTHTTNNADIQNTEVVVGTTIHDKAFVTGNIGTASPVPTGTVIFKLYSGDNCGVTSGSLQSTSSAITLVLETAATATTGAVVVAESPSFQITTATSFSYTATYSGDGNYPGNSDGCEKIAGKTVVSSVVTDIRTDPADPTTSVLNKKVAKGTTIYDVATVTGATGLGNPTGKATFFRYNSANCSGTAVGTAEEVTLTANAGSDPPTSYAISSGYTTTAAAGEFVSFKVTYTPATGSPYSGDIADLCEPICSFDNSPAITP